MSSRFSRHHAHSAVAHVVGRSGAWRLATLGVLCALACVGAVGVGPAAAAPLFGPLGQEAGQIEISRGMAIDRATGDVYVSDYQNKRVDEFDGSGKFLLAWGWGVANGAAELQTCTTTCEKGLEGSGSGQFSTPLDGVGVDNDPLSLSYGDVYVTDFSKSRVEKFGPSGEFILMFGGDVNETTGGDVCDAGEKCKSGTEGTGDGQFEGESESSYLAVGPGGAVYVGDKARVEVFEPSGVWKENISLTALSATGKVTALAVDSAGDMYVVDSGASGVREFEPDGTEKMTLDAGSTTVEALTLNAAGDLFVSETAGGPHFLEYAPSGKEVESFGAKVLTTIYSSMAFDEASEELYVYGTDAVTEAERKEPSRFGVWGFALPAPGPAIESGSVTATPGLRGTATLEATIDPEGSETTYRFEYVDQADFQASGYADASSTPAVSIGSGFGEEPANAHLTGLVPGGIYHYRVVASNSNGTTSSADQSVEPSPPALIEGPWATNVAATSVTLAAQIDPLGASTEYRLEYGTSSSYGHVLNGTVGEGMGYVSIGYHIQELEPHTTYHYRVVTISEVGTVDGADHTFTTQIAGGQEFTLPDGRAWELVSPPNKKGAILGPQGGTDELMQAAADGSGIAYFSTVPLGEGAVGNIGARVLSSRTATGWTSQDISARMTLPEEGTDNAGDLIESGATYELFSSDLSTGLLNPTGLTPPQSSEATERTLYLRNDADGAYVPLENKADVKPGTKYGDPYMEFYAATPDLAHVVFGSEVALTPEAVTGVRLGNGEQVQNLYEWSEGHLQLVNVLPNGETDPNTSLRIGATLGGQESKSEEGMSARAISNEGRWVVWKYGELTAGVNSPGEVALYVRDMVDEKTFQIGGRYARFETMSSDGSKIFYVETEPSRHGEGGDLHVFDPVTDTQTDLTAEHGPGEQSAGVQTVMGAGEDGSYVYFVATGVLANGAVSGADNLYVSHDNGDEWTTTYIATLSKEDATTWGAKINRPEAEGTRYGPSFSLMSSRVSPNGSYLAFMSERSLTGYDNLDAVSGQPDEEVYLYDAAENRLVCASCDPTGARPVGVFDESNANASLLVDRDGVWSKAEGSGDHWLAGSLPTWSKAAYGSYYQPRYLSDSGRLFFNSSDALVPQDTDGVEDVYQYEPAGVGSCTSAESAFNERSGGCVNLISSGTSSAESAFMDASEDGDDVFFATSSKLTAEDYDTAYDVYDAHVCSTAAPCPSAPVSPPPCTTADSCKPAPSPQPEIFGPAPSATFSGTGNVVEEATSAVKQKKSTVKKKPKKKKKKKKASKRKKAKQSRSGRTSKRGER